VDNLFIVWKIVHLPKDAILTGVLYTMSFNNVKSINQPLSYNTSDCINFYVAKMVMPESI